MTIFFFLGRGLFFGDGLASAEILEAILEIKKTTHAEKERENPDERDTHIHGAIFFF